MKKRTCSSCFYWLKNESQPENGTCRRYPPLAHLVPIPTLVINEQALSVQAFSPPTGEAFWCGEHQPTFEAQRDQLIRQEQINTM